MEQQEFHTTVINALQFLQEGQQNLNERFDQVDAKFKEIDQQFVTMGIEFKQINGRLDLMDQRVYQLERQMESQTTELYRIREKVDAVYEERHSVTVSFTRQWALASIFIAMLAAGVVEAITFAVYIA